ncbi:MAG TPA: 4-hydroxy-3-methylbut-2-enyl diphosphate reductase [Ignavibacteriales bacterium]|nr:4-hydroxy-3-methylbut-2-enyl diphosphate reductase [Ignavibacteriales bacterium]HOM64528.1 4-hydroxy-3-methylbut-2-enyl diphosphate reductase [Ignavibacteriales bacterium]HPD66625.1 4-hydroxy-3-methylbut-2-enyl diphosphate reductase [Ignavibacteriales bacterium]HPP32436.1 4-hydroxy-3-methylbut-2-enyl diphosphate reductase [Ignavibacteriales bacterium]HRR17595.1 4-hydroxy-3-methylbut-2-enyl diphosphate reductase [Ignavibacteriales bacterium]
MQINIDKNSGFCWGVVRTVQIAEEQLKIYKTVYCLGDIIHNPIEIERLQKLGLITITHNDLNDLPEKSVVMIRAHGEPPEIYKKIEDRKLLLVDATCPVVTKVQERIKKFYESGYQVVIFGKRDHPETIGLNGVTNYTSIVIKSLEEAENLVNFERNTVLFSQTTMDKQTFYEIADFLKEKIKNLIVDSAQNVAREFLAKDTICGQVSGRDKKLIEFAQNNDLILFVAGKKSSNGKVLFNIAKNVNSNTYFIEKFEDIDFEIFNAQVKTVGITGATSTPMWLMEEIKDKLEEKFKNVGVLLD